VLGHGGMGRVYLAEDPRLKRRIALKVMLPSVAANDKARQRFLREAQSQANIEHEHVIVIHQVDEDNGVPFIAMPLLKGETLADCLKREQKLPLAEVVRLGREIAEGLAAAHERKLIHRDIKPANIWLEGSRRRVKILDFGLARAEAAAEEEQHLTNTGAVVGTPAYMSPEQAQGDTLDARSDLFSVGCVLYQLATGELPFQGATTMAILTALAVKDPAPPRALNSQVPPELDELILRLLGKDRQARPATALIVAEELHVMEKMLFAPAGGPASTATGSMLRLAPPEQPAAHTPSPRRRRRWPLIAAGLLILVGGGYLGQQIVIRLTDDKGNVREVPVLPGEKIELVVRPDTKQPAEEKAPPALAVPIPAPPRAGGRSPLDELDPASIPAEERFAWQPKELVAVLGEHRLRHWSGVKDVAISPDGKWIASAADGSMSCLWDAETMRQAAQVDGFAVAFSPDGKLLVAIGNEGLHVLDLTQSPPPSRTIRIKSKIHRLEFFPRGERLVLAGADGMMRICNLAEKGAAEQESWLAHKDRIGRPVFSADGKSLATFGVDDGLAKIWDMTDTPARLRCTLASADKQKVYSLDMSRDGRMVATGQQQGMIRLWDVSGAQPVEKWSFDTKMRNFSPTVAFSSDGKALYQGGNREITVWALTKPAPEPRAIPFKSGAAPYVLAVGRNEQMLVAGIRTGLQIWDLDGQTAIERVRGHAAPMLVLFPSPDGQLILSRSEHEQFSLLWNLRARPPRMAVEVPANVADLSKDGARFATSGGTIYEFTATHRWRGGR
jgi:WD40 repeat protein